MRGPGAGFWRKTMKASAGGAPEAKALTTIATSKAMVKNSLITDASFFFTKLRVEALLNQSKDRITNRPDLFLGFRFRHQADDGFGVGAAHMKPTAREQNLHPISQIHPRARIYLPHRF